MQLDKLPAGVSLFGDVSFRGVCPKEDQEQISFFARLRREYPSSYGLLAVHPKNEGSLYGGQFQGMVKDKAMGLSKGAADIVIPASVSFVCEMKRADHTKSTWQEGQLDYLAAAHDAGAFACVALGAVGAWEAFQAWQHANA
jgi:hypothetical protein